MWFGTASHRPRLLSRRRTRYHPFGDNFCGSSDATAPAQNHLKSNTQNHCRACSGGSKCSWNNTLHDAAVHVSQISSQYQFHICISMGQNSNVELLYSPVFDSLQGMYDPTEDDPMHLENHWVCRRKLHVPLLLNSFASSFCL